jgi:hypothetical protein
MKKAILIIAAIISLASCSKYKTGDWVHFSSYHQYAILNNGDTVTYEDGFVMAGMNSGATKRQLTPQEQQQLLDMLDTTYRQTNVKGREPFEDLAIKWKRNYPGQTLGYMMKFQNHTISSKYSNLKVEDLKTIVCDYDSTYQLYIVDKDNGYRLYYTEFE